MYNIATLKKMKIKAEKLTEVTAALYCWPIIMIKALKAEIWL